MSEEHTGRHVGLTRREILQAGGSVVVGGAAAQARGEVPTGPLNTTSRPGRVVMNREMKADVVVVGGGMAGVCAALAAARSGASVVLIHDRPVFGGNASSEVRMHIVGADHSGGRPKEDARESGIIEELRLEDAAHNPQRSASMFDLLLYDRIRAESRITTLLETHCCGVEMDGTDRIAAVVASRYGTEETFTVKGKLFIDASGDGRLGVEAGAEFRVGREAQDEFGESLAPAKADRQVMGSTLLFVTRQHDRPMPFVPPTWIHRFAGCEELPHRGHKDWAYGYWWVEWGGEFDVIRDNERIRHELLAAALGVWDHIKNSGKHPSSEKWALEWLGFLPGKRESRRFVGDHVLVEQEVRRGEVFEDGVAFGGWPIDLHPPAGIYSQEAPAASTKVPLYNIPLRSLYSRNIRNMLMAGRNISTSHVAFGSTRVMATCGVIGQAAGTAAAMCAGRGVLPRELAKNGIRDLQQRLLRDDAYIIGATNNDPADLARTAKASASSETPEGPAANVVNGIHRGVGSASNRWISDPQKGLPQWIELRFAKPESIREIHLVFDTGLQRALTLTHSPSYNAKMVRGPQPETVRDCEILALSGGASRSILRVEGNYQRKRAYAFEPVTADGIRVNVIATNGDRSARVLEIRVYG